MDLAILSIQISGFSGVEIIKEQRLSFADKVGYMGKIGDLPYCLLLNLQICFSGGTFGLFTGMSLLSCLEMAFWIIKFFITCILGGMK